MDAPLSPLDDLHQIDDSIRSIQYDDGRRYQPLRLDKMFARATDWKSTSQVGPVLRPPTPPRRNMVYPLPLPLEERENGVSPLSRIFEYPELVPNVFKFFDRPPELATLALVSRSFCDLARKKLYHSLWIRPWEKGCDAKLVMLFGTLSKYPELCRLVKHLDVRFFPLATKDTERYDLDEHIQESVGAMTNLETLTWTRDRSLNGLLVERITELQHLRTLEISGHSRRYYDPRLLGKVPRLEELRILMPDSTFRDALVDLIKAFDARPQGGLTGFAVVAKSSPLVDNGMLKAMAPHLQRLKRLTFWGCTKITKDAVLGVLREAEELEDLSIDAVAHSTLHDLSRSPPMPRLHTLSMTFPAPHRLPGRPGLSASDLPRVPRTLPALTSLFLTLSGDRVFMPMGGIGELASQMDMGRIKRLSLLNLFFGSEDLGQLLDIATNLEELYVSVRSRNSLVDCDALRRTKLRILHANAPEGWGPSPDDFVAIARQLPTLEQIGTGNRVYEIVRRYDGDELVLELSRWTKTYSPGYFQIWRG